MKIYFWIIAIAILSFLISCASRIKTEEKQVSSATETTVQLQNWETEWLETLNKAKKESKLVIASSINPAVREVIAMEIKKRFGIDVEVLSGRGAEVAEKLLRERMAGIYSADIYMGGSSTMINNLKPAGVFQPLEPVLFLPEVIDPGAWYENKLRFIDKARTIFNFSLAPAGPLKINTNLVKEGEFMSYRDFLNPKWKGKIVLFDPILSGNGLQWFSVYGGYILSFDYMIELAKLEPVILRDQRLQAEWVSRGKYPISIAVGDTHFEPFIEAGMPIKSIRMEEGDYLSGGEGFLGLIDKAPHPYAAKLFINWILTKEGQTIHSHAYDRQSAREDVPLTESIKRKGYRMSGVKYFTGVETEEFQLKKPFFAEKAQEIFGHLIGK